MLEGNHAAVDPVPNRHFVELHWFRTELDLAYGVAKDWDVELDLPFDVKDVEARYELPDGTPFDNPEGDLHHRDERLEGISDLKLFANYRPGGVLLKDDRLHVGLGVSLPVGKVESDPWELGAQGSKHQHIQFGTGTWDPLLGLSVARTVGGTTLLASGLVRLVVGENEHGYRAGHRYAAGLVADRPLAGRWRVQGGLDFAREDAERWNGVVEEEGNLGRTDLLAGVGVSRPFPPAGTLTLQVKVPLLTRANGAQLDYPLIVVLGWSR